MVVIDQASKQIVVSSIARDTHVKFFLGIDLTYTRNRGIAFGALGGSGLVTILTIAAVVALAAFFTWRADEWQAWEVGPGTSIVPTGERYVSATGEIRLRYTLDASLATSVREVRLNRLDVTAVGAIR